MILISYGPQSGHQVTSVHARVQFLHQTVKDFLTKPVFAKDVEDILLGHQNERDRQTINGNIFILQISRTFLKLKKKVCLHSL